MFPCYFKSEDLELDPIKLFHGYYTHIYVYCIENINVIFQDGTTFVGTSFGSETSIAGEIG